MQERLAHILNNELDIKKSDKLLIAVSGGADSTCLLRLLVALGYDVSAAHVNYGLRGPESNADQTIVEELCTKLKVQLWTKRFDLETYHKNEKLSIQQAARRLRYNWFDELLQKHSLDHLVTAHNMTDNVETLLINQIRGTGVKGLAGIRSKNDDGVIRPLLQFTSDEIRSFMKEMDWPYRIDSSNLKDNYLRNRIRHRILPELLDMEPSVEHIILRNSQEVLEHIELTSYLMDQLRDDLIFEEKGETRIPISRIRSYPHAHLLLYSYIYTFGFDILQCKEILASGRTGAMFYSSTHQVNIDRDQIIVTPKTPKPKPITISKPGSYVFGTTHIEVTKVQLDNESLKSPSHICHLDPDSLKSGILIRSRQNEDKIQPLGMQGHKLVSDVMIDAKIPDSHKDNIPIFTTGNEIVWVSGLCFSERFKINDGRPNNYVWRITINED